MKKITVLLALLFFGVQALMAQVQVAGTVTSAEDGQPIPGVSVVQKGTTNGTITGSDGKYTITVPEGSTLVYSFVGMTTKAVEIGNQTVIDVVMDVDAIGLEDVVVVGYGTNIKRDVTGAVSSVKGDDISESGAPSVDVALQGRAPGVQVTQGSGVPGSPVRILVRGTSSISSGTEPLYIVDGFPIYQNLGGILGGINPLSAINPKDIESIEVLKDAAATAIYGSRGSNGVIIITTKSGKHSQGQTIVDYSVGFSNPANMLNYVGGQDWLNLTDEGWANDGHTSTWDPYADGGLLSDEEDPSEFTRAIAEATAAENGGDGTDWLDPIMRTGVIHDFNISSSKGFENGQYYISGNYKRHEGILKGNDFDKYGLKTNLDFEPVKNLKTGVRANLTYIKDEEATQYGQGSATSAGRSDKGSAGGWASAIGNSLPIMPIYSHINPARYWDPLGGLNTVVASDNRDVKFTDVNEYRAIVNTFLDYTIIDGLSIRSELSGDFIYSFQNAWASDVIRNSPMVYETSRRNWNYNWNAYATYNKEFGDHKVNVVAGYERQFSQLWRTDNMAENVETSDGYIGEPNVIYTDENGNTQTNVLVFVNGTFPSFRIASYFSRLNYAYKGKYLFGASFRRDGASTFGKTNRFGNFPAFSLGWIVTEEDFASNLGPVNFLKVRASYGKTGNASIPDVLQDYYAVWPMYAAGGGVKLDRLANRGITWENTSTVDIAAEFGMFENRISGSIGYYQQNVADMLLEVPIPYSIGHTKIWANVGEIKNSGVELQLTSVNVSTPDFRWSTTLNFATNKNEVVALNEELQNSGKGIINGNTVTRVGGTIGEYFLPEFVEIDPTTGDPMVYAVDYDLYDTTGVTQIMQDVSGQDSLVLSGNDNSRNRMIQDGKSGLPTWYGGISNTLAYKGIELSFLFTFQGGNYLYDDYNRKQYDVSGNTVIREDLLNNYWTPSNTSAEYARLTKDGRNYDQSQNVSTQTSQFLEKGDFLRLKSLRLSYTFPQSVLARTPLKGVKIYAMGTNLLTFTKFKGYDPEVTSFDANAQNRNLRPGWIGGYSFPQLRTFTFGATLNF